MSFISKMQDPSNHSSHSHISDLDDGSSILSELLEDLGNIPVFESDNCLLQWLEVERAQMKKLIEHMKPAEKSVWGPYFESKVGTTPVP
jgi:hypothetical protein